jgi:MYXO-CTERM domain-containing protein
MKKLLLAVAMACVATVAFGQGQIIANNGSGTQITNTATMQRWVAGVDSRVGVYAATGSGMAEGSLVFQTGAVTNLFGAGLFSMARTLGIPAGAATVQIRAWSGAANATYEDAVAASMADSSVILGKSVPFNITLTASPAAGAPTQGLYPAFTVSPVPEPSSIALGLLGLGAIALFRRRK